MALDALKRERHVGFGRLVEVPLCRCLVQILDGANERRAVARIFGILAGLASAGRRSAARARGCGFQGRPNRSSQRLQECAARDPASRASPSSSRGPDVVRPPAQRARRLESSIDTSAGSSAHRPPVPERLEHRRARCSASALSGPSASQRISEIPGDASDQYRRNLLRASSSVAIALVSVSNTDVLAPIGSARSVQTIFTYPGSANAANRLGGTERNVTSASHGFVTAPTTTSRPGTSPSTTHPSESVASRMPRGLARPSALAPRTSALALNMARATGLPMRSICLAAESVSSAGALTRT